MDVPELFQGLKGESTMKDFMCIAYKRVIWRRVLGLMMALLASFELATLILHGYSHRVAFYRMLAVTFGLSFGALYTRMSGGIPRIKGVLHEIIYYGGWVLYGYGGSWVMGSVSDGGHGVDVHGLCWLASITPGFLLGCDQPIKGAGRTSWWLCKDTFIGWMRSTMRVLAIVVIAYCVVIEGVSRLVGENDAISWHSIMMAAAALVSLCHTWFAIPRAPSRETRVVRGEYRTNMDPALS